MMKKGLSLVLAGVMAVALVGCGGDEKKEGSTTAAGEGATTAQTEQSSGPVTLNVKTTYAGNDSNAQNYLDAVADWEAKSGNTVSDSSATSDETFKATVTTDFEVGSEPDVLFYFNGADSNSFVEAGKVVSIDEIRAEFPDFASNMKDEMLGASPVDGKNYSVPVNGYWEGMFVNKQVLEAAGVEVPSATTTWDDFLAMCETLKSKGFTPIAASLQEIPHYWFEFAIYNFRDPATHNMVPAAADDEVAVDWAAGLDDIKVLYEKGYFPENTLTATDAETFELFTGDQAAFLIDGSWKIGGIEEAVDDIENFTVTYVPGKNDRKTTDIIGGISMGYYITKKAWNDPAKKAAAVDFVSHMTSDAVVSKFAGTSVTALKNAVTVEGEISALAQDALTFCAGTTGISPAVQDNLSETARAPIFTKMADIVTGVTSSADAVAATFAAMGE